jgi:hypothetical protein
MKSRRFLWAGSVIRIGEEGNLIVIYHFEDLKLSDHKGDWNIILYYINPLRPEHI